MKHSVTFSMRPPGVTERIWHRRLGLPLPLACGSTGPWHARWVRLLPYRWRRLHHAYAVAYGFFWRSCDLCDRPYGGHEYGDTIPDPTRPPNGGITICSRCTIARTSVKERVR